ncbi:MAG TPA: biotin/lipoyl-binding protein, partial [Vicinamibacterales bacterium]|nr:biotin/lipoyl-binding protein [Vicinamibacterales bacterium]
MKRRTLGLLAGTGLVLVATAAALERGGGVLVDTAPVARKADFRSTVTSSGQIVAQRYADIGSSVMGRLVQLRVREGDAVEAGQVVARIDAVQAAASASAANARVKASEAEVRGAADTLRAAEADLDAARARAQEAQLTLRRTRDLRADGLVPAAELDRATAAAETADAQLRGAEAALRRLQQAREATERRLAEARAEAARAADVLLRDDFVAGWHRRFA